MKKDCDIFIDTYGKKRFCVLSSKDCVFKSYLKESINSGNFKRVVDLNSGETFIQVKSGYVINENVFIEEKRKIKTIKNKVRKIGNNIKEKDLKGFRINASKLFFNFYNYIDDGILSNIDSKEDYIKIAKNLNYISEV